jgi:acetylxylan esterase
MPKVLAATYPDLMTAVSLYSDVPVSCLVLAYGALEAGTTPAQADRVKPPAKPGVTLWEPCIPATLVNAHAYNSSTALLQVRCHRATIGETVKQCTDVFDVGTTPTSSKPDTPENSYRTNDF